MLIRCVIIIAAALAGTVSYVAGADVEDARRNSRTVYFTVGDYQDLLYTPLDSSASINAAFDVLANKYGVRRVWWRGGQDEVWGKQFVLREQSRRYARLWDWWRDLQYRVVNTNAIAVKAGRDRGIAVWMAYGLFDNGSPADVGFGGFPYAAEDKIRVEHPEWAPINKYGTWRQGGPIEFAYPEARKAMVEYLTKHVIDGGYDGIAFLSYAENYSMRYEDEFGYSQPIVDEFRKRYGVDIRTQSFDRGAWARLRGDYLTQFVRELHAALAPAGRKIAVSVDGRDPHLPCLWNVAGGVRTAGRLHLDIETWIKEQIVDEINLYYPNTDQALASVMELCKGSKTSVSIFGRTRGALPDGAGRIMTVNTELESGFDWENYIDFPDENVTAQPPEALTSPDIYARRRIATAIHKGKQVATVAELVPLLKDPDIYVRRAALRGLATLKEPEAIPAVKACLHDPENGVRWLAAVVLGRLAAPDCVKSLLEAAGGEAGNYQFNFVAFPSILNDLKKEGRLSDADALALVAATGDANSKVRETAWYAIRSVALSTTPGLQAAVLRCLKEDPSPYSRELALLVMLNLGSSPQTLEAARDRLLNDADEVVQVRASTTLAGLLRGVEVGHPTRTRAVQEVADLFRQYGSACRRQDRDWGWREVGNALRGLSGDGDKSLERIMSESEDRKLADLAWRVVFLRQEDQFCFVTEEADRAAHAQHPFLKFANVAGEK